MIPNSIFQEYYNDIYLVSKHQYFYIDLAKPNIVWLDIILEVEFIWSTQSLNHTNVAYAG